MCYTGMHSLIKRHTHAGVFAIIGKVAHDKAGQSGQNAAQLQVIEHPLYLIGALAHIFDKENRIFLKNIIGRT